jgi:membrane protease YdiL (CAAX protease family)
MEYLVKNKERVVFIIIVTFIVILPIIFFCAIKLFDLSGLPVYFAQLGLYAVFFLLAFWGIRKSGIRLTVKIHTLLDALFFLLIAWLIYVLILSLTGIVRFSDEIAALKLVPAWKIWAQILSTWIFVGLAEELLFRGYILNWLHQTFTNWSGRRRTLTAILVSSAFFSLWHLPVRIYELVNGESSIALILLSVVVLFVLAVGFAWLYIRTENILLVGLVHGVMDFPLIGGDSQLTFIILIAAIGCVEFFKMRQRRASAQTD